MNNSINSQMNMQSFKGRLILQGYLAKNFDKSIPEFERMIENKPYDVFVRGVYSGNEKRGKTITLFKVDIDSIKGLIESTNKTKHGSYVAALKRLIDRKDESLASLEQNKKTTFKEKIKGILYKIVYRLFLNE